MKILIGLIIMLSFTIGCKGFSLGEFGYDNKEQKVYVEDLNVDKSDEIMEIKKDESK